jgi:hypothetical protein
MLLLADGSEHDVVVTACDGDVVTVRAPRLGPDDAPAIDDEVTLRWATARGRHEAAAQLVGVFSVGGDHWDLAPVGEIASRQERRYVRGGGGEAIEVTRSAVDAAALRGTVVDLAERSVRATLTAPPASGDTEDPRPAPAVLLFGEGVAVTLRLGATSLSVPGRVSRVTELPGIQKATRTVDTVVLLDVTDRQADTLRRYIFDSQRRARNRLR